MELEGVVHDGVIVPDDATALMEGMRVRITPVPLDKPRPFGERFARFKGARPACRPTWRSNTTTTAWGRRSDDRLRRCVRADRLAQSF